MIDKIFPGKKLHAIDRKSATEARRQWEEDMHFSEGGNSNLVTSGSRRIAHWCRAQAAEGKNKLPQRKNLGWTLYQSTIMGKSPPPLWLVTLPA